MSALRKLHCGARAASQHPPRAEVHEYATLGLCTERVDYMCDRIVT